MQFFKHEYTQYVVEKLPFSFYFVRSNLVLWFRLFDMLTFKAKLSPSIFDHVKHTENKTNNVQENAKKKYLFLCFWQSILSQSFYQRPNNILSCLFCVFGLMKFRNWCQKMLLLLRKAKKKTSMLWYGQMLRSL